jgi:hypothetical protein
VNDIVAALKLRKDRAAAPSWKRLAPSSDLRFPPWKSAYSYFARVKIAWMRAKVARALCRKAQSAIFLATRADNVHVVHVASNAYYFDGAEVYPVPTKHEQREAILGAMRRHYTDSRFDNAQFEVCFGDPGCKIAERAPELDAGLIVWALAWTSGICTLAYWVGHASNGLQNVLCLCCDRVGDKRNCGRRSQGAICVGDGLTRHG